jgi:hypothetical protein
MLQEARQLRISIWNVFALALLLIVLHAQLTQTIYDLAQHEKRLIDVNRLFGHCLCGRNDLL